MDTQLFSRRKPITIGLPRAMLYHRYEILWKSFFSSLGIKYIVSEPTNKKIITNGSACSIDEACLPTKIFLGHVQSLLGKCDYIFVPRISNFGIRRSMCTKFESLYDISTNTFRDSRQKFLAYEVDVLRKILEEDSMIRMAQSLGYSKKEAKHAYKEAKDAQKNYNKAKLKKQEELLNNKGLKILIISHSYVGYDPYIGTPVASILKKMGVNILYSDVIDRKSALKQSIKVSPTLRWELSRESVGAINIYKNQIDGIILLSAFPCGPDSMVNEMIISQFRGMPTLNIVLDDQSGTAGLETRLESFIDILKLKGGQL